MTTEVTSVIVETPELVEGDALGACDTVAVFSAADLVGTSALLVL